MKESVSTCSMCIIDIFPMVLLWNFVWPETNGEDPPRYHSLAKVTTRRARKRFHLRYNPDSHWSSAFYKGLNQLQYNDGRDAVSINRDDATGFRLDTLTTCKQYATPAGQGKDVLTTRTMSICVSFTNDLLQLYKNEDYPRILCWNSQGPKTA